MLEKIQEKAAFLKGKMHTSTETAIILGTGLGSLADEITEKYEIKYSDIPNFPISTVEDVYKRQSYHTTFASREQGICQASGYQSLDIDTYP